jgi:hypothetical protein
MKPRDKKIIVAAIFCLCVMLGAQVAQTQAFIFLIPLVFGLAVVAGYAFAWLCDNGWGGAPAGVTADSALSLFYNAKNNEMTSLTVGLHDEASSINATGYYLGRKAEYAAMNFLNNTIYPTYPKWQVFDYSSANMNQSVLAEIGNTDEAWLVNYNSAIYDMVRYAQQSFTGPLNGLDLKFDTTSCKTGINDFMLVETTGFNQIPSNANVTIGYLVAPQNCLLFVTQTQEVNNQAEMWLEGQLTTNSTTILLSVNTAVTYNYTITPGVYKVIAQDHNGVNGCAVSTNGLLVDTGVSLSPAIISETRDHFYTTINFIDTHATTYTISVTNKTQCDPESIRYALDATQNFANNLANAYWTTLRNAGIYSASQIPSDMVIPPPDVAFLTNTDLSQLSVEEIQAMYLAYLKALGNFYNSTTYTNILNFNTANVTFANEAVLINASASRNSTIYTEGFLYLQVYDDMNLTKGLNTLNSSGLLYNLNDTTCWSYAAGDVLNISNIYVRMQNGSYVEVNETIITALTIDAYIYNSTSGPPLTPTGSASAGGGGGSGLLILAVIVIAILLLRGRAGGSSGPVIINKAYATPQKTKTPISPFFSLMNQGEK